MTVKSMANTSSIKSGVVAGKILQVVSTTKTDAFTVTSSSYTEVTGLTASITPSSSSSKILVAVSLSINPRATTVAYYEIRRDSTSIGSGTASGSRPGAFASVYIGRTFGTTKLSGNFLDSPSSTSALTYSVRVAAGSGVLAINTSSDDTDSGAYARTSSTITLIEVAG